MVKIEKLLLLCCLFCMGNIFSTDAVTSDERTEVIVLSGGKNDNECSMVRFLFYTDR